MAVTTVQALQEQSAIQTAMFERMFAERAALMGATQQPLTLEAGASFALKAEPTTALLT